MNSLHAEMSLNASQELLRAISHERVPFTQRRGKLAKETQRLRKHYDAVCIGEFPALDDHIVQISLITMIALKYSISYHDHRLARRTRSHGAGAGVLFNRMSGKKKVFHGHLHRLTRVILIRGRSTGL